MSGSSSFGHPRLVIFLDELLKLITRFKESSSTATVFVAKPTARSADVDHGGKAV